MQSEIASLVWVWSLYDVLENNLSRHEWSKKSKGNDIHRPSLVVIIKEHLSDAHIHQAKNLHPIGHHTSSLIPSFLFRDIVKKYVFYSLVDVVNALYYLPYHRPHT